MYKGCWVSSLSHLGFLCNVLPILLDWQKFAEDDEQRKESVEIRNQAESAIYQTEKTLSEKSEKIDEHLKNKIESSITDLKSALESDESGALKEAFDKFMIDIQDLGQAVYSQQETAADDGQNNDEEKEVDEPEAVDGEFREV